MTSKAYQHSQTAPSPAVQEPTPKRRKLKPKKGGKARRRRALRNMPSDVWAAVFGQLPAMARELPGLRLVCRQVPPDHEAHTLHVMLSSDRKPACCSVTAEPLLDCIQVLYTPLMSSHKRVLNTWVPLGHVLLHCSTCNSTCSRPVLIRLIVCAGCSLTTQSADAC